jgi:hypothetical protein
MYGSYGTESITDPLYQNPSARILVLFDGLGPFKLTAQLRAGDEAINARRACGAAPHRGCPPTGPPQCVYQARHRPITVANFTADRYRLGAGLTPSLYAGLRTSSVADILRRPWLSGPFIIFCAA